MTIVLHNGTASFHISRTGWGQLLELGQRHGWQPAGAEPPQWSDPHMEAAYADLSGVYTSVNDADARGLAAALEGALSSLPDERADTEEWNRLSEDVQHGIQAPAAASNHDPDRGSAREDLAQVIEFVAFASQGRFSVLSAPSLVN